MLYILRFSMRLSMKIGQKNSEKNYFFMASTAAYTVDMNTGFYEKEKKMKVYMVTFIDKAKLKIVGSGTGIGESENEAIMTVSSPDGWSDIGQRYKTVVVAEIGSFTPIDVVVNDNSAIFA